jgi:hypothetical protein
MAPTSIAPSAATTARPSERREHVAPEAVGAEQEQRRGRLVPGSHQVAAGEQHERNADRSILFVPLFELADAPPRIDEGGAE